MTAGALSQFVLFAVFGAGALGQLSEVWNEVSQAAGAAARIGEIMAVRVPHRRAQRAPQAREARPRRALVPKRFLRLPRARGRSLHCATWASASRREKSSPSSARRARASPRSSSSRSGFTIRRAARSRSTAPTFRGSIPLSLRAEIALVPQDAFIFGASVADNIADGVPGCDPPGYRRRGQAGGRGRLHRRPAAGLRYAFGRARRRRCRAGNASASRSPAQS